MFGKTVPKTVDNFVALATGEVRHYVYLATTMKTICSDVVGVVLTLQTVTLILWSCLK